MFTPKTRLIIIIGCTFLAGLSMYQNKIYAAAAAISFILITVYGYVRQGTVYLAFKYLRKNEPLKAEETLKLTKSTKWLSKTQKGYYYFVKGFIDTARGKLEEAKNNYEEALKIGLKLTNDTALTYANLASIHNRQKNKVKARDYIQKAKALKVKKHILAEIERVEAMIG